MNAELVDRLAAAILYEGYILYPYRASSKKNQQRFTFGRVYPEIYSQAQRGAEPCVMQTECLVRGDGPAIETSVRFLQPMWREILVGGKVVAELMVGDQLLPTWQEAIERRINLPPLPVRELEQKPWRHEFTFPLSATAETVNGNEAVIRRRSEMISGAVEISAERLDETTARLRVRIVNQTPVPAEMYDNQDAILMRTFASTHTILSVRDGEFISLLEPPPEYADAATACQHLGAFPVLVGDEARRECDTLLSSPIILYDYPKLAPESPGDLCDGTEIDEILTLRIMAMTDAEKNEMRQVDAYARRILERTESLPPQSLMDLHGTVRERHALDTDFFNPQTKIEGAEVAGVFLQAGDRVRICPKKRADAMDMLLAGKTATIEAVEQDVEGAIHFALVLVDDPGADIGFARMPGHRFFYASDEVEPLDADE